MTGSWTEYKDAELQARALAKMVAGQLGLALAERGWATLALPGGSTPERFLRILSKAAIDWAKISVLLTDERFVPESSTRSNTRLLRENLFQGPAASARLVPMYLPAAEPEQVLNALRDGLRPALPLDVCVLGMGTDRHIASLFPGADLLDAALDPDGAEILLPMRAPGAPEPRLTLTAAVLRRARHLHLLIQGTEKRAALEAAEQGGPAHLAPVRIVLDAPAPLNIHYTKAG